MKNIKFCMKLQFYQRKSQEANRRPWFGVGFSVFFWRPVQIFAEKLELFVYLDTLVSLFTVILSPWVTFSSLFTWFRWLWSQICRYLRGSGGWGHRFVVIYVVPKP